MINITKFTDAGSADAIDVEFISRRLVDENRQLTIWGTSIVNSFARISKVYFAPRIGWTKRRNILVFGAAIYNKLSPARQDQSHLILRARDPFRLSHIPKSFTYDLSPWRAIFKSIENGDNCYLIELQERIIRFIGCVGSKILVVNSTIDPLSRMWLHSAKKVGVKTICVQHGVYAKKTPNYVQEEDIVDRYIALDDTQASIVARNIDPRKIVTSGIRGSFVWTPPCHRIKVCFVGEDWERYGHESLKEILVDTYRMLGRFLMERGLSVCYKPHPSENQLFGIEKEMTLLHKGRINEPDVFIGFASSLLKEMASHRKLSIQLYDHRFNTETTNVDLFSEMGYCLSVYNDQGVFESVLNLLNNQISMNLIDEINIDQFLDFSEESF